MEITHTHTSRQYTVGSNRILVIQTEELSGKCYFTLYQKHEKLKQTEMEHLFPVRIGGGSADDVEGALEIIRKLKL